MSARIRFRGGPLAGKVYEFDDDHASIVVGRDPERCDVVLPADWVAVGREHLALHRSLGRYRLVLSPNHAVYLDGERALSDTTLPDVATLTLGENGPRMVVHTVGSDAVPPTLEPEESAPDTPALLVAAIRRSRANRRILLVTAGALVMLALAAVGALHATSRRVGAVSEEQASVRGRLAAESETLRKIEAEQHEVTEGLRSRLEGMDASLEKLRPDLTGLRQAVAGLGPRMQGLEERIQRLSPRIREALHRAAPSVYVVIVRREQGDDVFGTAWVGGPGVLVTNAHVARLFEQMKERPDLADASLVARSPGKEPKDHVVESVEIHPGWQAFTALWDEYRPTDVDVAGRLNPLYTAGACDVALLHVSDPDTLAPPLEIAPEADLLALDAGDVVGFVGYPAENMASGGVNPSRPIAQTQVAHVTAVTNYFLAPDEPEDALLVQHSLPATGGASGSPILDPDGRVVAVLNAGNVTIGGFGQRIPSAVLVNFAQRADLVSELLEHRAAAAQEGRTKRWREGIRVFTSLRAAVERNSLDVERRYLAVVEAREGKKPEALEQRDGVLGAGQTSPEPQTKDEIQVHLPGAGLYVFFVYAAMGQSVGLEAAPAATPDAPIGTDRRDRWYALIEMKADGETDLVVRVLGPRDTEYRLHTWRVVP